MKVALAAMVLTLCSAAQNRSNPAFDELARRAFAAVDSKPEEAVRLYKQALEMQPSWAEGWFYVGASLYQLSRSAEAREAFRHATALAPRNGPAWAFLGQSEYELGDFKAALADIRKGETLGLGDNQGFVSAVRYRAALICLRSSDFTRAMDQLRPLAVAGDSSPAVLDAFGIVALGMAHIPADVPAEKRALVSLAGRAAWALYAQHPDEAGTLFRQLAAQYPDEPGVHYAYGIFFLDRDPDAALAEFQKELRITPSHAFARLQIAFLKIKSGDAASALELAQQAAQLQPGNSLCHVAIGRAFLNLDQVDKAIPALESAVKLAPDSPQTHFYLEQAYRRAGKDAQARKQKAEFTRLMTEQDPLILPGAAR